MQQISNLPVFTGTIPNKATQNDTDFANNIFGFLNYSGNIFVADFNSTIGEFNTLSAEIELVAETIGANLKTVTDKGDEMVAAAEAAIAVLENGTINDLIIGENKAYSNQKINNLLETLDLSNIAETITLKYFTSTLKAKLDDIAENANNYSHPSSHDASMINESTTKRFVSDTEKDSWNAKLDDSSGTPAGTIITFASATAPTGYLKANGALLSRTTYSALFAAIGTTFGIGNGSTTFALPDLRGYFPRGWDDGRGVDNARVFGSAQADAMQVHRHSGNTDGGTAETPDTRYNLKNMTINGITYGTSNQSGGGGYNSTTTSIPLPSTLTGSVSTSSETRPKNIALLYCIKY